MKKRYEKIIEDCKECPAFRKPIKKLVFCDLSCLATPHVNGEGISKYCPLPDAQNTREIEELLLENEAKEILCPAGWCQKIDATDFERELEHRRTEFCRRPYGLGRFETCNHFPNKNECWKRYIEVKRGLKREVARRKGN